MNNIQNLQTTIASTLATQSGTPKETQSTAEKQVAPLLSGESVTVTTAMRGDLSKLVATLKNETQETKTAVLHLRLASVLDAYTSRYGALSAEQTRIVTEIADNNYAIEEAENTIESLKKELSTATGQAAIMQTMIESLEHQVEQAVEDGKIHRERVAKLKEQRSEDVKDEDLEAEIAAEEAAAAEADARLSKAQGELATAQSSLSTINAKVESLETKISDQKATIASLESANSELTSKLGTDTMSKLVAVFRSESVAAAETAEGRESTADRKEEDEKAEATNPANRLREAMDKADDALRADIDVNREETV